MVTAADRGENAGCLVGFHAQSSIDPRRYCVWLSKVNRTYSVALRTTHLGIHFLRSTDLPIAELFGAHTGDDIDKFQRTRWTYGDEGVPVLSALPQWLLARRTAVLDDGGDHACFALEPIAAHRVEGFEPLRLSQARHLTPGHPNRVRS